MNILQPLLDRLRAAGPNCWEQIAAEAGVAKTLPRKLVYGDRPNPTISTIQPLFDYFAAVDRGERLLPNPQRNGVARAASAVALATTAAAALNAPELADLQEGGHA